MHPADDRFGGAPTLKAGPGPARATDDDPVQLQFRFEFRRDAALPAEPVAALKMAPLQRIVHSTPEAQHGPPVDEKVRPLWGWSAVGPGTSVFQPPMVDRGAGSHDFGPSAAVYGGTRDVPNGPALSSMSRGTHGREDDPLLAVEYRAAHTKNGLAASELPRGSHVRGDDPLRSVENRAMHASRAHGPVGGRPADGPRMSSPVRQPTAAELRAELIAHVRSLSVTSAATEAIPAARKQPTAADLRAELIAHVRSLSVTSATTEAIPAVTAAPTATDSASGKRARVIARRRWRIVPIVGAAGAVVAGIGGGTAVAYIVGQISGSTQTVSGRPAAVTIAATAASPDLLPGQPGAVSFTLHNPSSTAATLSQIMPGATVISNNTALCPSTDVSIVPALPYSLPTPITVGAGATSGTQSVAKFVSLAPDAPSTCQGVTFSVSLTLSGDS